VPIAATVGEIAGLEPSGNGLIVTITADAITRYHLMRGEASLTLTGNTQEGGPSCA